MGSIYYDGKYTIHFYIFFVYIFLVSRYSNKNIYRGLYKIFTVLKSWWRFIKIETF